MKIALLGAGKTGIKVTELHKECVVYNSKNIPTLESLKECDVIISFLAGEIFLDYIPLLIESKKPVVTGSTGFEWPKRIDTELKAFSLKWIKAHNFSLGMNIVKEMIQTLSKGTSLYEDYKINIHDIHHTQKLDSPSGTAVSWKNWLGQDASITSERLGDVVGYHHLELQTEMENIKITHEAKDRSIFANGALWAATEILKEDTPIGLNDFSEIVKLRIKI